MCVPCVRICCERTQVFVRICCERAQVFVHSLRKVDMRAMIGQSSTASVVVRGAMVSRRVAAYTSHPDELQVCVRVWVLCIMYYVCVCINIAC